MVVKTAKYLFYIAKLPDILNRKELRVRKF